MKTATVTDLRRSFGRIYRLLKAGESIEITRHGEPCANIVPALRRQKTRNVPKPDIMARLKADFGDLVFPDEVFERLKDWNS
jgi:antitoxin (DNA-binding transcriptional repressor) of toxin-antitoxin stability system